MQTLIQISSGKVPEAGVKCVALAHNEIHRTPDFLRHHRELGLEHFLIVDDHSTDGTREYLQSQADVTLFQPKGTTFKEHKALWRKEILDNYCVGQWTLVLDLDELFVYPHYDRRPISKFIDYLNIEKADAVFAPMVEMYAGHDPAFNLQNDNRIPLIERYPYFDSDGYRLLRPSRKFFKKFPTPPLEMYGGPRERLFYHFDVNSLNAVFKWLLQRFAPVNRSVNITALASARDRFARLLLGPWMPRPPLVMSKIPLIKWSRDLRFPGGPHAVSGKRLLSEVWGALLHFKFMDFVGETRYRAARGQHAKGAIHYKLYEDKISTTNFNINPYYAGSRRYTGWRDLTACHLLRSTDAWDKHDQIYS